jgi:hypothetical protein
MVLLGHIGQVKACFSLFGDSVSLGTRKVHGLRLMNHGHGNRFRHTRWYSYVMYVSWKLILVCLDIVLVSMQDRCKVYAKRTIGSEIILDAPDCTRS